MSGSERIIKLKADEIIKVYLRRIMAILVITLILLMVNGDVLLEIMAVNRVLSTVILTSFLLGVFLCCRNFYRLKWDFTVLCDLDNLLSVRRDGIALRQYQGKTYMTSELYQRLESSIEFDQSGVMVQGLKPSIARSLIDMVKNGVVERRNLMSYFSNLLIYLGLIGTFIGLFATVGSITGLIGFLAAGLSGEEDLAQMLVILIQQLEEPLSGMGIAFGTSLAGLSGSIVISALAMNVNRASALFAKTYSDWLIEFAISDNANQGGNVVSPKPGAQEGGKLEADNIVSRLDQLMALEERQLSLMETMTDSYRQQSEAIRQLLNQQTMESLCAAVQSRGEQLVQLGQRMTAELEAQRVLTEQQLENQQVYQSQATSLGNKMFDLQMLAREHGEQGNRTLDAILDQIQQLPDSLQSATADQVAQVAHTLEQSLVRRVCGFLTRYVRRLCRLGRHHNRRQVDSLVETVQTSEARIIQENQAQIEAIQKKQNSLALRLLRGIHRLYRHSLRRNNNK
ncbi:hypothetical protein [Endozoicomonas sp. ONNA2]|uniref:hypothetical protein n=1 Tax=Endozoicomonas sp. ONNA2 TaxID=2828741 RepID=UPI00214799FD|nr:hypothetical protein [Endozoicomonas sp. ONNA2]